MKILVIGDSCKDVFIYGKVERLSPDAPVPILIPLRKEESNTVAATKDATDKSAIPTLSDAVTAAAIAGILWND